MKEIPDRLYPLQLEDTELIIAPSYDYVRLFKWLGMGIIKYWNSDTQSLHDIYIDEDSVKQLKKHIPELVVVDMEWIGQQEHERYVEWQSANLDEIFGNGNTSNDL